MIKRAWCADTGHAARTAGPSAHRRRGPLPGPQAGRRATPPPPRDTQHRGLGRRGKAHHDRRCEGEKDASNSGFSGFACPQRTGRDFDLPRHSHYSGVIPMVFQHSGGRDFDLPRHSHYSGVIPMVFQHSGGRDFDLPRTLPLLRGYPYGVSTQWGARF